MAEISINEYVRTKQGYIAKVNFVEIIEKERNLDICTFDKPIYYEYGEGYYNLYCDEEFEEIIVNHSKNIIDLNEVGDYVNGELVTSVYDENKEDEQIQIEVNNQGNYTYYINEDIKSIVTKEQFKSIEYRVGE